MRFFSKFYPVLLYKPPAFKIVSNNRLKAEFLNFGIGGNESGRYEKNGKCVQTLMW